MLRMSPTTTSTLRFKNFKGGDYRAKAPGGTYRVRRVADDAWPVDVRVEGDESWSQVATGTDRKAAEQAANDHCGKHGPAELARQAEQRRAVAQVAAACARRIALTKQLDEANEQLEGAVRAAFSADVTAGPLLEVTTPAGITTRNRLYQIRDGRR